MKSQKPDLQNRRILRFATRFVVLPLVLSAAVYGWVKGMFHRLRSDKYLRAEDQLRQSRVRRELRGLSPDHPAELPAKH